MSNQTDYKVGDRVQVLLHSRTMGYKDTGGGWTSDWMDGKIVNIRRVTVVVYTDEYYYSHLHSVPLRRIRKVVP
jgi:hypothetical protein